jgi:hypothetical protein
MYSKFPNNIFDVSKFSTIGINTLKRSLSKQNLYLYPSTTHRSFQNNPNNFPLIRQLNISISSPKKQSISVNNKNLQHPPQVKEKEEDKINKMVFNHKVSFRVLNKQNNQFNNITNLKEIPSDDDKYTPVNKTKSRIESLHSKLQFFRKVFDCVYTKYMLAKANSMVGPLRHERFQKENITKDDEDTSNIYRLPFLEKIRKTNCSSKYAKRVLYNNNISISMYKDKQNSSFSGVYSSKNAKTVPPKSTFIMKNNNNSFCSKSFVDVTNNNSCYSNCSFSGHKMIKSRSDKNIFTRNRLLFAESNNNNNIEIRKGGITFLTKINN